MATLRATQFFAGEVSGSGNHTLYTVPTGKRIVVHGITVQDYSGVSHAVQIRLGSALSILAVQLAGYANPGCSVIWNPYVVVNAADTIVLTLPGGGDVAVTVSGTFLFV